MPDLHTLLIVAVTVPLVSFALLALFGFRLGKPWSGWLATLAIAVSCVLSVIVLVQWQGMEASSQAELQSQYEPYIWTSIGPVDITFGVHLDSLTVIMFFMVSFVATWIHVFSIGYMASSSDEVDGRSLFHRFFAFLSLFCFSMLGLVVADSLLQMFMFWELVGLCSYLLIGFYFHKKSASNAAIKAFVTNSVANIGFVLGLAMVFFYLGDFSLNGAAESFKDQYLSGGPLFSQYVWGLDLATWMGILLFCGAIGKSAQFPLHVWLPDAMEGPTPVSALIHAATMVAAGVYLVARIFVLLTPSAQLFIAVIGCITLALAALIAVVQTDIKRVLAYSTISQLGYMILGMGVGAWIAALFHLMTHAFFKALMFLGSGQVIEGCHHEQDMRRMGGLRKKMPVTCWTFFVGVLAIAGVGIPTTQLGIGGFFSKDEILAVSWHRTHEHSTQVDNQHNEHQADEASATGVAVETKPLPAWLFWIPIIMAYVTPFYMMRCWWITFMGRPRDEHVYEHAHERPLMYVPLIVLALGTLVAGCWLFRPMLAHTSLHTLLVASYDGVAAHAESAQGTLIDHHAHSALVPIVGFAFVIGFVLAWLIYRNGLGLAESLAQRFKPVHTLLVRKFYFDELYGLLIIGGVMVLKSLGYLFDRLIVDGLVNLSAMVTKRLAVYSGMVMDARAVDGTVNAIGNGTWLLGGLVRAPQVGRIRNYILFAVGGATVVILIIVFPW